MRVLSLSLMLILAALITPSSLLACSCAGEERPKEALSESDAVFTGRAVRERIADGMRELSFDIQTVWKGALSRSVIVMAPVSGAMCGYPFKLGPTYIVYARRLPLGLHTGLCDRTRPIEEAGRDLHALGQPRTLK